MTDDRRRDGWIEAALRTPSTVRSELAAIPGFLPGVLISALVGLAVSRLVAEVLAVRRGLAWALMFTFGITLAATLTPSREALDLNATGAASCDLSRLTFLSLDDLGRFTDSGLNVWLFVPLGCAIGLMPLSPRKLAVAGAALLLPFAIELIQLVAPVLGRACQSADVIDNLTGLVGGVIGGTIIASSWSRAAHLWLATGTKQVD